MLSENINQMKGNTVTATSQETEVFFLPLTKDIRVVDVPIKPGRVSLGPNAPFFRSITAQFARVSRV